MIWLLSLRIETIPLFAPNLNDDVYYYMYRSCLVYLCIPYIAYWADCSKIATETYYHTLILILKHKWNCWIRESMQMIIIIVWIFSLQVDLEPQGKIHVIVELKWHGMCVNQFIVRTQTKIEPNIEFKKNILSFSRAKQCIKRCHCSYQNRRIQRASRFQSSSWCYAKTCSSGTNRFFIFVFTH